MKYQSIIEQMSVFEKAQMMTGKSTWETKDFEKYNIPSIFLSDGPHGIRKQLGSADHLGLNESIPSTCFPTAATIANSWNLSLAEEIGEALGQEAKELGVNVILGPGMNIKRNPLCGRNFEYFSEDPLLTGKLAAKYVKGIQKQGIAATPKHFAVNSQELRRMSNDSIVDERTLREIYLSAFEYVVKEAQPQFIMTSYNRLNGEYTNEHHHLLQDILYDEWQYDGVIVTDWGGSNDHVKGVIEGSHLEMPGTGVPSALELVTAIEKGELSEAVLDQRVEELLDIVMTLTKTEVENRISLKASTATQHHQLAYRAAQESIVLLKNEAVLPLKSTTKVGFIGDFIKVPRYQGAGSSVVNPTQLDTIEKVKMEYGFEDAPYCQGYHRSGVSEELLINQAVNLAKSVEVPLIFMGLTEINESEGMDRTHMSLSEDQLLLVEAVAKVNPKTVVILSGGSAVEMPFANKVAAIVHQYLGGQAGARAVLDVLTGKINPSGKLAETYPLSLADVASSNYYPGLEKTSEYREGLFVGYRYFNTVEKEVLYPFGFGLSYTKFEYSQLAIKENQLSFVLTNIGETDGAEVAQVYLEHESTQRIYVKQQLIGFEKVFLKAGESQTVTIELPTRAFEYFNTASEQWEVDGGQYSIGVGAHSRAISLKVSVEKNATTEVVELPLAQVPHYFSGKVTQISAKEFETLLGRPIPESSWDKTLPLQENDTISQLYYAKGWVGRGIYQVLNYFLERSIKKGQPNLNLYFNYNMTFRAISKMTGGMINKEMVNHILTIVNGQFFRGLGRLIKAAFHNHQTNKKVS